MVDHQCWNFLCLGKPTYVFPQTKAEKSFSNYFLSKKAILGNNPNSFTPPSIRIANKIAKKAHKNN